MGITRDWVPLCVLPSVHRERNLTEEEDPGPQDPYQIPIVTHSLTKGTKGSPTEMQPEGLSTSEHAFIALTGWEDFLLVLQMKAP